jgi:hypothetical protein
LESGAFYPDLKIGLCLRPERSTELTPRSQAEGAPSNVLKCFKLEMRNNAFGSLKHFNFCLVPNSNNRADGDFHPGRKKV